jgi:hypothetical protein
VSITTPKYEGDLAKHRPGIAAGVPYLSLTEFPWHDGKIAQVGTVVRSNNCDHVARMVRRLNDTDASAWKRAMETQRRAWEAWIDSSPKFNEGRLATVRSEVEVRNLNLRDFAKYE